MIETTTHVLNRAEPCYGMSVREEPDGFKTRLAIMRGDELQTCVINHGPDEEYSGKVPPLFVPSVDGENSVALMLDMSEAHRQDLRYYKRAKEMQESSTLFSDVLRQEEEALAYIRNQSSFGPLHSKQRNGYSHEKTVRDWFDTRDRRTGKKRFAT